MPRAESSNPKDRDTPSFESPRQGPKWLLASLCLIVGVLLGVALWDYAPEQSVQHQVGSRSEVVDGSLRTIPLQPTDRNLVGIFGAEYSYGSILLLGAATYLVPFFLIWMAVVYLRSARRLAGARWLAILACILCSTGLLAMQDIVYTDPDTYTNGPGGVLGRLLYDSLLRDSLGVFGAGLIFGMVNIVCLVFILTKDIGLEIERLLATFADWRKQRAKLRAERAAVRESERARKKEEIEKQKVADAAAKAAVPAVVQSATPKKVVVPKSQDPLTEAPRVTRATSETATPVAQPKVAPQPKPAAPEPKSRPTAAPSIALNIVKPEETRKAKVVLPVNAGDDYQFPPIKLLAERERNGSNSDEDEHRQNAENLLRILSEFGVEVTLGEIHVGPVITRYEVVPAAGVRVEKIAGLDKNIALGMRAQSVRILAPIPGKAAVGVEVPNQHATPVGLRDILESEDWAHALAKAEVPIALGKDVSGKPIVSDLTKMPHLLIAGATGSGKSVCINSIIASILYSKSPKDLRLLMVDPKIVELKIFNTLPHMLIPVVTEPKKVPAALKWLLSEMEQRYQIFAKVGVRNIIGFNGRKKSAEPEVPPEQAELAGVGGDDIEVPDRLPYIVAIIDELADLMMAAPAEVETSIARLAQLARAAGIHLIIATQRPSVNVITGVIKANLPSRIAFQVASQVDSRTILDGKGADTLIGRGDMLFSPPGSSKLVRAQGAFVADEEVSSIVDFLKRNGPPQYAQSVQQQIDRDSSDEDEDGADGGDGGDLGDDEQLFMQAFDVLKSSRRASTSMLQRRLRIGYNRAARIMEIMEEKGIVGPENGSSPRDILVDLDTYQP